MISSSFFTFGLAAAALFVLITGANGYLEEPPANLLGTNRGENTLPLEQYVHPIQPDDKQPGNVHPDTQPKVVNPEAQPRIVKKRSPPMDENKKPQNPKSDSIAAQQQSPGCGCGK